MGRFAGIHKNIAAQHQAVGDQSAVAQAQVELVGALIHQGDARVKKDDILLVIQKGQNHVAIAFQIFLAKADAKVQVGGRVVFRRLTCSCFLGR